MQRGPRSARLRDAAWSSIRAAQGCGAILDPRGSGMRCACLDWRMMCGSGRSARADRYSAATWIALAPYSAAAEHHESPASAALHWPAPVTRLFCLWRQWPYSPTCHFTVCPRTCSGCSWWHMRSDPRWLKFWIHIFTIVAVIRANKVATFHIWIPLIHPGQFCLLIVLLKSYILENYLRSKTAGFHLGSRRVSHFDDVSMFPWVIYLHTGKETRSIRSQCAKVQ